MTTHITGSSGPDKSDIRISSSEISSNGLYYQNFVNGNRDFGNSAVQTTFNTTGNSFTPVINMTASYGAHSDSSIATGNMYLNSNQNILPQAFEGDRMQQQSQVQLPQQQQQQQMTQLEQQEFNIQQSIMKNAVGGQSREYMGGAAAAAYNAMRQDYLDERQKEVESDETESKTQMSPFEAISKPLSKPLSQAGTTNPNPNEHYELLKQHRMNLLEEIQETALMLRMYEQQRLQKQDQQLKKQQQEQQQKQQEALVGKQYQEQAAQATSHESADRTGKALKNPGAPPQFVHIPPELKQHESQQQKRILETVVQQNQRSDNNFSPKNSSNRLDNKGSDNIMNGRNEILENKSSSVPIIEQTDLYDKSQNINQGMLKKKANDVEDKGGNKRQKT